MWLFCFVLFCLHKTLYFRTDREFYNPAEANSVTVCALELDFSAWELSMRNSVALQLCFCKLGRGAHGFVTKEEALRIHCCGQPFLKTLQRWQGLECYGQAPSLPAALEHLKPSWEPGDHSFSSDRTYLSHSQQICVLAKSGEHGRMPLPLLMSSDYLQTSLEEQAALVP